MIAAVIPAYNEAPYIRRVIEETGEYVDKVIVVDDGSVDETARIVKETNAILIRHRRNMGKGEALKTGFKAALKYGADIVVTLDGDYQHKPDEIKRLLSYLKKTGADIVVGSRFLTKENIQSMPAQRILSNMITSAILRFFFRVPVTDSQSGFRAFKASVLKVLETKDRRFAAETEILIDARQKGFIIREAPISIKYGSEKSKINPLLDTFRWLRTVFIKRVKSLFRDRRVNWRYIIRRGLRNSSRS
ncbi:MAG: glycosyltransferase family 2 protein [Candidatus Odinarchaeum yellowstonii]|jgi:glycosyltransferase involved in cell wall biosynthesis|uniref:Glycosyltransferase family 2 protein n=1 Tax=Odinarchaeota yellowstonii (strain LCB_4) TaxID=1841599 RepID=A0AAF0D165_ODILC|nr:MAG: glycosyltransferase family 2 protein [Candidatus Odinarchaeum yellowstonii]